MRLGVWFDWAREKGDGGSVAMAGRKYGWMVGERERGRGGK